MAGTDPGDRELIDVAVVGGGQRTPPGHANAVIGSGGDDVFRV